MTLRNLLPCATLAMMAAVGLQAQDTRTVTEDEAASLCKLVERQWVSVHDPSVVRLNASKTFYIAGTMRGWARSSDNMVNWTALDNSKLFGAVDSKGSTYVVSYADAFSHNYTTTVPALVDGEVQDVSFGNFDAKAWAAADQEGWSIDGNMWAPDIIYNPNSKKWMMYFSLNGDDWHSCIVLLTADQITGPYVYQGPVHFSGFLNTTTPVISYKLTDLETALGELDVLPARYALGNNWGQYWTNDIDPCVFFDQEGELWMTYGSWSGGIFMLKMDKQTGLRDYTVTYPIETDNGGRALSDPYFGRRIAGGYRSSGEGSYIQHIGDYYYLFMSYGGYSPDGGYEMRTYRSQTPEGPYLDAAGYDACFHDRGWTLVGKYADTNGGMKLLGAYNGWGLQTVGECAQGHNSATDDVAGRNFVVYHTKFNNGTAEHQVRTRQLLLNENGWLCAAPFQFDGETVSDKSIKAGCEFTADEIAGNYQVLIHKYKMDFANFEEVTPINITLYANGSVTGSKTGKWSMTDGTGYITLTLGGVTYRGVVIPQTIDGTNIPAIGITATSEETTGGGVQLWAYQFDARYAVALTAQQNAVSFADGDIIRQNINLPATPYLGAKIQWASSEPGIITTKGIYRKPDVTTPVTLTCTISYEDVTMTRVFNVTAAAEDDLPDGDYLTDCVAHYPFTSKGTGNQIDTSQKPTFKALGSGTVPTIERDALRSGMTLHQYAGDSDNASYTLMTNPLYGLKRLTGMTIAAWVKMNADNNWDCIWSFTDQEANDATARLYMTGNAYIGYNNNGTFFDINHPNNGSTGYLPTGQWAFVAVVINTRGVTIYVDGEKKPQMSFAGSTSAYGAMFTFLRTKAPYMQLGTGSFWGSADCNIDDLLVYSRALSDDDVALLTIMAGRSGTDFTAISDIAATDEAATTGTQGIFDLSGRRINGKILRPGIYVINGRKVAVK